MLWTFEKNGSKRLIEVRSAMDGAGYELRYRDKDAREVVETFQSVDELSRRMMKVETDFLEAGWCLAGNARLI